MVNATSTFFYILDWGPSHNYNMDGAVSNSAAPTLHHRGGKGSGQIVLLCAFEEIYLGRGKVELQAYRPSKPELEPTITSDDTVGTKNALLLYCISTSL